MGADEVGTLKGSTERRAILDRLIGDHRGRIANTAGDSVLAEFGSVVDAVQCAVEAQAALADANAGLPAHKRINFRIGVHIGDVLIRAGDLFGDGVNIACQIAPKYDPLFAAKNDPFDGAETGGAEAHIAEQSRSWRAASGERAVMRGS